MNTINNTLKYPSRVWQCLMVLFLFAGGLMAQPQNLCSTVNNTGSNHTVAFAPGAATLNGSALASGSHIIIGFMDGSTFRCINYTEWTGVGAAIPAYGAESGSNPRNGFNADEDFVFRVEMPDGTVLEDISVTYAPTNSIITRQGSYATDGLSQVTSMAISSNTTPPASGPSMCGVPVNTGGSQTIVIPTAPQIEGANLQSGAYIIIGYEDNAGVFHCVNYTEWSGIATAIPAYIDDATTSAKDGFESGDEIVYQIEMPNGDIVDNLIATYKPVGGLVTAQGTILGDKSISQIESLSNAPPAGPSICGIPEVTSGSQTIAIPVTPQISGADLQNGAFIIVGYEDNAGVFHCVNYVQWDGNNTAIAAYVNDNGLNNKNGFDGGDELVYQIEMPNGTVMTNIVATYEPIGGIITAQGTFVGDKAVSVIKSLEDFDPIDCTIEKPVITLVSATPPTCAGGNDGELVVDVTYTHAAGAEKWTSGPSNRTWSGLTEGTYTFTASDIHNCSASASFLLTGPAAISIATSNIINEECTTFGSVTLSGNGGLAPYTFSGDLTVDANGNVTNLSAGTYGIVATDANGCVSPSINVIIGNSCGCIDNDKDGVCKEDDCDDNNPNITYGLGSTCDDNDPCTDNDRYDANCNCVGTPKTTDPVLVGVPAAVMVQCDAIPIPATVTAGSLTVDYRQDKTGNDDCNYLLTRTWTVDDGCGNTAIATQIITVKDDIAPVLVGVPGDITINVNNGETLPALNVTATDNCDPNPTVNFATASVIPDPCSNQISYPQTWSATDACGNTSASQSRTITIINDDFFIDADGDGVCDKDDICAGGDDHADADNDGTPDFCDTCDDNLVGTPCSDGDDCTVGDMYDANCSCISGPVVDTDNDGVCDADDICQGYDDNQDADNDGTPDGCEQCDGSLTIVLKEQYNISCHGANDGKLVIEIQGGDAPYNTSWTNGPNTLFYSNLSSGTYTVSVADINDCRTTQSFTITEPAPLQVNVVKVTPQGCDLGTGAIDVEAFGGTAPYTYNWIAFATTEDISDLNARNYQLEVTDANGCKTNRMTIAVPRECGCDNLTAGGKVGFDTGCERKTTVCVGGNSRLIGSCTLPSGGSGTIEYLWLKSTTCPNRPPTSITNDPNWTIVPNSNRTTLTVTNLSQTTCYIRCARRSGCDDYLGESNIVKIEVDQNTSVWYADTDMDTYGDPNNSMVACDQPPGYVPNSDDCDDGNASIPATPGSTCSDGNPLTTNDKIQADGCTCKGEDRPLECPTVDIKPGVGEVTITGLTSPKVILGIFQGLTNVYSCNNNCVDGASIPLSPGTYLILIQFRDAYNNRIPGCDNVFEPFIIEDNCVDKDKDGVCVDADCDDTNPAIPAAPGTDCDDGDATTLNDVIQADGCGCAGTPAPDCYFNGGDYDNDGVCADADCDDTNPAIPATPGTDCDDGDATTTDDKILADGCGCAGTPILMCDLMVELANKIDPGCSDRNDGIVAVSVSKGQAPYYYKWSNGKTGSAGITQLVEGDYTVSVTDANGCEVIKRYSLVAPAPIMATKTITHATCGQANGAISLTASGGNGDYQYMWNGTLSTASQTNLGAGTYTVIIRDRLNCEAIYTYVVENRITSDCDNGGELQPTRCNFEVRYSDNSISIDGNVAKVVIFKGYNETQNVIYSCQGSCPTSKVVANIPPGDYGVKIFNHNYSCVFDARFVAKEGGNTCTDAGKPCNDGNDCTIGDVYDANCNCISGILQDADNDGVCDVDDICPNGDDTIDSDGDGTPDACDTTNNCTDAGKPCDDGNDCTIGDKYDADCNCMSGTLQDADSDGVCDGDDCAPNDANYPKTPGTGCDDGDENTTNDVIQSDGCGCAGTPVSTGEPDCDAVTATPGKGTITVNGLTAPIEHVKVYRIGRGGSWTQVANCAGDCGDTWVAEGLVKGDYIVQFTLRNASWGSICDNEEENISLFVTVVNGAASSRNSTGDLTANKPAATTLKIYPNPAQETVTLDLSNWTNKPVNVSIRNHFSQVVYEQHIEQVDATLKQINLTSFANGLYYIHVQGTDGVQPVVKKLIVNRLY